MTSPERDGWKRLRIAEVAGVTLGKTPKKSEYRSEGQHRLFKYRDIQQNALVLDQTKDGFVVEDPAVLRGLRSVEVGDVLVGASGHTSESIGRKVAIVSSLPPGGPHYVAGELLRIKPHEDVLDSRWVRHYLSSGDGFATLQGAVSGVHLTNGRSREMMIPVAPFAIQQSIADILDAVSDVTRLAATHLSAATGATAKFRRSVLAAACRGRLTSAWRNGHAEGPGDPEHLPKTWNSVPLGTVAEVKLGGTPSRKNDRYWGGDIAWVSSGEVANGRISATRESISQEGLNGSNAKLYPAGAVLIAMIGEGKTRGQSAILDVPATTNQNVAGILCDPDIVSPEYVWRWALAEYEVTRAVGRGGNQPALNRQRVEELIIPVAP